MQIRCFVSSKLSSPFKYFPISLIPITLFEATVALDSGPIYLQRTIELNGTELIDDWRNHQFITTFQMCLEFLDSYEIAIREAQPHFAR